MTEELSFGRWLRRQRRSLDLTQQALADQVGCARITLRRIENDALRPSRELASILLKSLGIPERERAQWVLFARGLAAFPENEPGAPGSRPSTNLPYSLTSFIGREKEQADLVRLIHKHRLVTLSGAGGIGKTRLSLEIGRLCLADFTDGVWLVELAAITDPEFLPQAVTLALGLVQQPNASPPELLANFLRPKNALLILDNCEHLLDGCAHLSELLLKNCPDLKILTTSREALGITGEAVYRIQSLGLPDLKGLLETFKGYESVRLFEERAQLAQADFALTLENLSPVAQICVHLDGIPLAIELAAARVTTFSVEQIAIQLKQCFQVLTGGSRTALPRQQTIQASIDWSWNLLSGEEQTLFQRLSIFAGGWTLDSAQAICGKDLAHSISSLVSKSLVVSEPVATSEIRYHLHDVVRQYAWEKLTEAGDEGPMRARHLRYFFSMAEQAEREASGAGLAEWLSRLETEHDNLRAALGWSLECGAVRAGLLAVCQMWRLWVLRGMIPEGHLWCAALLAAYPVRDALRLRGVRLEVIFARQRNDLEQKRASLDEAHALAKAVGLEPAFAYDLREEALYERDQGNIQRAIELLEAAIAQFHQIQDATGLCETYFWLAEAQMHLGKLEKSRPVWEAGLELARQLGDAFYLGWGLGGLADQAQHEGRLAEATSLCQESLTLKWQSQDKSGIAFSWETLALIATGQGNYERAAILWGAAQRCRETIQSVLPPAKRAEKERSMETTRARLGREAFERAWAHGHTLKMEQALEYALSQ